MQVEPQKEHAWLQQLVGEWTYDAECSMGPDQPPARHTGTETVRSVGGLWIVAEGHGEMPGCGPATTLLTVGYDPQKGRFVGTWIGSMMTYLWTYEGELDPAGRALALHAEGPSMLDPTKPAQYKDVHEIVGDGRRTVTSYLRGEDGEWVKFVTAEYRLKR